MHNDLLPLGIHFHLDEDVYHADPGLGSTDLKRLIQDPFEFWWHSKMNPNRPEDTDSSAKLWGRAFHKIVLEGEEAFKNAYVLELSPESYGNNQRVLISADDLKAYCKENSLPVSGTKADLSERIRGLCHDGVVIWDEVLAKFRADIADRGATILKPGMYEEITRAARFVTGNPNLTKAFTGGVPEVSVIWEENGIRLKCRIDFLKPVTMIDLKSFSNIYNKPLDTAIMAAIAQYRMDVQSRHYRDGYRALIDFAKKGAIHGPCPLPKGWHKVMAAPEQVRFTWVFHQKGGAPITKAVDVAPNNPMFARADRELAEAKHTYRKSIERFGEGPWVNQDEINEIDLASLPYWFRSEASA